MDRGTIGNARTVAAPDAPLYFNFSPGKRIGPHTLHRLLGVGGMGEVYEVTCDGHEGRYALKILARSLAADPRAVASFEREARLMHALRHPNVVAIDDAGADGPFHWLRMELMRSVQYRGTEVRSLDDYLRANQSALPQGTFFAILENVVGAVAAAHTRQLVHRDLKPANILMTHWQDRADASVAVMDVRVADFGMVKVIGEEWVRRQSELSLSRLASLGERETFGPEGERQRALVGTYAYMSPEQREGLQTDARTDVYSLGLLAFRALIGGEPCPTRPSRLRPDLLPAWDELLTRSLNSNPARRFADGQDLLAGMKELGQALSSQGLIDEEKG